MMLNRVSCGGLGLGLGGVPDLLTQPTRGPRQVQCSLCAKHNGRVERLAQPWPWASFNIPAMVTRRKGRFTWVDDFIFEEVCFVLIWVLKLICLRLCILWFYEKNKDLWRMCLGMQEQTSKNIICSKTFSPGWEVWPAVTWVPYRHKSPCCFPPLLFSLLHKQQRQCASIERAAAAAEWWAETSHSSVVIITVVLIIRSAAYHTL